MNFPYEYDFSEKHHLEMTKWCEQNFGPRWEAMSYQEGKWCVFWNWFHTQIPRSYRWYFQNDKDATLFLLRWS